MMKTVVVGAGFGGLRVATLLARRGTPVTLIDKNDYHTYIPLLYEIAVTSKELANHCDLKSIITVPIKEIIAGLPITFIQETVNKIDVVNGDIHLPSRHIHFDCLVLALGSETNYFNIPGLQEHALTFKSFLDAVRIRDTLTTQPLGAKPKVVIGGAGATGVELAGEIQFSGLGNVTLIQSPPDILAGFEPRVVTKARRRLDELGAHIIFDTITQVTAATVSLKNNGDVPYDLLVWTGGVQPNRLVHGLPLKKEVRGRVEVVGAMECLPATPELQLTPKIYAVGDLVCMLDEKTGKPVPGLASVALDQATIVAANILGKKRTYQPKPFPYILPIGGKYAIFTQGNLVIDGFFAWLLKGLVELKYLAMIMPLFWALKLWLRGLKIFLENDRLG